MSNAPSPRGVQRDIWSPDRPATASKRSLIAVSHVIERALLDGPISQPTVIVAMFQRQAYLQRQYEVYGRLAEAGAVVVLGFADGEAHQVPPGCQGIVLDPDEPLADEWTVIAVGPHAGVYLVATDAHRFDPTEQTLEAGREFNGRWGYSRVQAGNELARMRAALGSRLGTAVSTTVDHLLARVMPTGGAASGSRGTDGEMWATISLHKMIERMQDARAGTRVLRAQLVDAHAAVTARTAAHIDPQSGLTSPEFLSRWTDTGRPTALPVGVAVIDVPALDRADERYEARQVWHASRRVAAALTEPLGPVDAAVRLSDREFALVIPGASNRHLRHLISAVGEQLELASDGYPGITLGGSVASTVTLTRPLPLDDLHLALGSPDQQASTLAGDPITVVSTADAVALGGSDGRPITDALPRVRVGSVPTTSPDDATSASADLATPAAGMRAVVPDGSSAGSSAGTDGVRGPTDDGIEDVPASAAASSEPASGLESAYEAGYDDGHEAAVESALESALESAPSEEPPAAGEPATAADVPATGSPSPFPRERPDEDVTKRADRTMNVLAGLPRRNRRNGQHARHDPNSGPIGPIGGTNGTAGTNGFAHGGNGTFGDPPQASL